METLIKAVKDHANANYENGWDEVVEAWGDGDIAEAIGEATSITEAIINVGAVVGIRNDYINEIKATAF
jgi:hypothetical protein